MANINVRAKDATIEKLKRIADATDNSQGEVIEKALDILEDFLICKQEMSQKEIDSLPLAMKLIIKKI